MEAWAGPNEKMIQNEARVADPQHASHHQAKISELHLGHLTSKGRFRFESYELAGKFMNHARKIIARDLRSLRYKPLCYFLSYILFFPFF